MEIIINRTAQQQTNLVKAISKQFYYKQYAIAFGIAITALILMFTKINLMGNGLPFWNPFSAFTMGILMIALLRLTGLFKQHKLAFSSKPESIQIIISEEAVTYHTETHEAKFQWSYFKFYRLNGPLIIIAKDTTNKNTLTIDKNEIGEEDLKFLQNLFFTKKISKR